MAVLLDQEPPEPTDGDMWWFVEAGYDQPTLAYYSSFIEALWLRNEVALAAWIVDYPGTRPSARWSYSAHGCRRAAFAGRRHVARRAAAGAAPPPKGGQGTPRHEARAYVPTFWCGVPHRWITIEDLRTWPNLVAEPFDPSDPPRFKAEARYLKRHGLFLPGERRWLRARWISSPRPRCWNDGQRTAAGMVQQVKPF